MKFFNSRIVTSEAKLDDAVKAAKEAKVETPRSLDELLADLDAQNKGIKTAGSDTPTKTAEVQEAPKASPEVKVQVAEGLQTKEAAGLENIPEDKRAKPFGKKEEETAEKGKKEDDGEEEEKSAAAKPMTIKMASSIDFRNWEAEDVVKAWQQHGSVQACMKNVGDSTDNPKMYCGLLQTASQLASETLLKRAAAEKAKTEKTASAKDSQKRGTWKVLAKLTDKERSMLDKYWRKLYGDYYVDAMLNDY